MTSRHLFPAVVVSVALIGSLAIARPNAQQSVRRSIDSRPDAVVDLRTPGGIALVKGAWRYHDAAVTPVDFHAPGPDLKPTGPAIKTYDIAPKAGEASFDDASWTRLEPTDLEARRSAGRLSFAWYRTSVTIPSRVGALDPSGATVVFEIVVDDYAEIWVDGRLPRTLGQTGGALVRGFNAPNRVVLTENASPGQTFQLAVFAANGPISEPPANYIWIRSATLDFFKPTTGSRNETRAMITRLDPAIDSIVPPGAVIEKLAEGFTFTEGPVWAPDGYLLFSDPNDNTIYRWSEQDGISVFRTKSGYTGLDIGEYKQPGSNGLAFDAQGRLTIAEHGNRRVSRLEANGAITTLADKYDGRRLNSPNDLVYKSDGSLYFTDPPFGLPKVFDDPRKETPFSGVYRVADGTVQLLATELTGPNGLAFSPDERYLYVGNWDERRKVVMRYPLRADGTLGHGTVFVDMTSAPGEDAIDGVKVDERGNVYVSGPGGVWVLSPEGRHLGTIAGPEHPHNLAWGDADRRTLYLTAISGLYRIRLEIPGSRPGAASGSAVTYLPASRVRDGFAKGDVLLNAGAYQIHASRREMAGQAEVHEHDTDIIYMLEGSTTFVTGGRVVGGAVTAPGEVRGSGVEGGETRTVSKGDVIVVPKGTPHWFKDVSGPVLYYVVKVQ